MTRLVIPVLLAFYVTLMSFFVLNLFYGRMGKTNYNALLTEYTLIKSNINDLEHIESTLTRYKEELENNGEALILAARKVGYYQPGEKRIIVENLTKTDKEPEIGKVIHLEAAPYRYRQQLPHPVIFVLIFLAAATLFSFIVPISYDDETEDNTNP
jgi:hypothetical protein